MLNTLCKNTPGRKITVSQIHESLFSIKEYDIDEDSK